MQPGAQQVISKNARTVVSEHTRSSRYCNSAESPALPSFTSLWYQLRSGRPNNQANDLTLVRQIELGAAAPYKLGRQQRDFRRQREQLEAKFVDRAGSSGKPRGLRWSDVAFEDEVSYARDRKSGQLRALVAIEVCFEAIEGGGMEEVEAVSNVRAATAEFLHDGTAWTTEGRVFFNLAPKGLIRYLHTDLESVERIVGVV